jgi:predicted ATPase
MISPDKSVSEWLSTARKQSYIAHATKERLVIDEPAAATCFRQAIEVSQRQHARAWELRATMSLARLLVQQGRRDEARATLAEIYGWFTAGFDTVDLKEAKALLNEIN